MTAYPPHLIRNFCITAHIDHGKTTLSTTLMTRAGVIHNNKTTDLYLDKLKVERERGITVKAQTTSMLYEYEGHKYILNLIDTPGHVDFHYEVSRSMYACEGAILLVDAVKGVQAQTVANWWLAYQNNLSIIAAINKVDLSVAQPQMCLDQLSTSFGIEPNTVLKISAATGMGIDDIFAHIIELVPPPDGHEGSPFKALLFDSWYENVFSGVVCLIKVANGSIKEGDKIVAASTKETYEVQEVGIMYPETVRTGALYTGQVGYVKMGMKTTKEARIGDTFYALNHEVEPFPGFKPAQPMVFSGIYPEDASEFSALKDAIEKLTLTDSSVSLQTDMNDILGMGYRIGFLGLLHMDVFLQRLREEYQMTVIATAPSVTVELELYGGDTLQLSQASKWPEGRVVKTYEPIVMASIFVPKEYMGNINTLCLDRRGVQQSVDFVDSTRVHLRYKMPLSEVIYDFFDKLKQLSSGYATFDYEDCGYEESDLCKLTILLNGEVAEPLSIICHRPTADQVGRKLAEKLKDVIRRQMYEIRIQAAVGGKILARETIKPFRKDVTAKCYGGDITRKRKLLEKQKEGKKRMRMVGNVELSQDAFLAVTKL